jgi:hypothetical protein
VKISYWEADPIFLPIVHVREIDLSASKFYIIKDAKKCRQASLYLSPCIVGWVDIETGARVPLKVVVYLYLKKVGKITRKFV